MRRARPISPRGCGFPRGRRSAGWAGPRGLRFARARDRLLGRANIRVLTRRVLAITPPDRAPDSKRDRGPESGAPRVPESARERVPESVRLADQRVVVTLEGEGPIRADRVVLACGGLTGGGVVYDPPDFHAGTDMPERDSPAFRFSFEIAPFRLDVASMSVSYPYLAPVGGARAAFPQASMFAPWTKKSGSAPRLTFGVAWQVWNPSMSLAGQGGFVFGSEALGAPSRPQPT